MGNREPHQKSEPLAQGAEDVRDSKSAKSDAQSHQKGPQAHAEGQHGSKTHARFIEQLHEGRREEPAESIYDRERHESAFQGERRLVEDREQHDEAEKNSEHTQLFTEHELRRDDGPSDNSGNLHGVLGNREHRADYKQRGPDGLEAKD